MPPSVQWERLDYAELLGAGKRVRGCLWQADQATRDYVETTIRAESTSRSHKRDHGHRTRPPRLRSLPVTIEEAPDVCMLELANHNKRRATQDNEDSHGAVEVLVLEAGRVGLHDQGDLRDDESEAEEGDPGPKPREEGAVVR